MSGLGWKVSPLTVLETEARYPGLFDDLATEEWQREMIKEQIKGTKTDND